MLADPAGGGQPLYSGLPGGDADCASEASLARARPSSLGAKGWGRGGAGGECWFGLVGGRGLRTGVRWCGGLATWPVRIGMGAEVGARRREKGVRDNVLFV